MDDIVTEHVGSILRSSSTVPRRTNAMTSAMYVTLAELLNARRRMTRTLASCSGMAREIRSVRATTSWIF